MSLARKLLGQTALYGLSSIVGRLLNYLLVPLYTRVFAPEEYGVVTELYAYVVFLVVLLTYGMETAFFRFAKGQEDGGAAYRAAMLPLWASSLGFGALLSLAAPWVAEALGYAGHASYIRWFAWILAIDALTAVPFARLRQQGRAARFAALRLANIGLNIGLNLFFLVFSRARWEQGHDGWAATLYDPGMGVGYIFLANLAASALTLLLLAPELRASWGKADRALSRRMVGYGAPLLAAGLAGAANETLDRVLLKHLLAVPAEVADAGAYVMAQLGIYGANYKLAVFMTLFVQTFRYALEPFFFARADAKDAPQAYAAVTRYFVLAGWIVFLAIVLHMPWLKHFIGADYHSGLFVVPILLVANLLLGVVFNLSIWYKLTDRTRDGAWLALLGGGVTLVGNLLLVPRWGYAASAWTTLACYASMAALSYRWGQRHYPVPYPIGALAGYSALALGLYAADALLYPPYWAKLMLLMLFVATAAWLERGALRKLLR